MEVFTTLSHKNFLDLKILVTKAKKKRDTCTQTFFAALFTIVKLQQQPRCPTTDEWIRKMWHIYTMEFYSAIMNNDTIWFEGKWK
jgi:hypothetical protein